MLLTFGTPNTVMIKKYLVFIVGCLKFGVTCFFCWEFLMGLRVVRSISNGRFE